MSGVGEANALAAHSANKRALVSIESRGAIPALIQALDDENAVVEYYAQDALARLDVGMVLVKP